MPREYQLKRPTMDLNRLKKVAKSVLDDSKKDREHALEYLRVFRAMLTENPNDDASKKAITDCLKLAQTSKGNVVKVNFGDPNMRIKKSNPKRRKSFRARHNCDNPGPKWKARYWSCKAW